MKDMTGGVVCETRELVELLVVEVYRMLGATEGRIDYGGDWLGPKELADYIE